MKVDITIMSGAGNIFSVIDGRKFNFTQEKYSRYAEVFCSQGGTYPQRTEGLLVVNAPAGDQDFSAWFFNPDGSYGAMCGNGARCAVKFAVERSFFTPDNNKALFMMQDKEYLCEITGDMYEVYFPPPKKTETDIGIKIENSSIFGSFINVGSRHFVINYDTFFKDDFFLFDVNGFAPKVRNHADFAPEGVNVNIFKVIGNEIFLRTFERGVEAETGACGTGAVSTAIAAVLKRIAAVPVTIIPSSKKALFVDFKLEDGILKDLSLRGDAEFVTETQVEV